MCPFMPPRACMHGRCDVCWKGRHLVPFQLASCFKIWFFRILPAVSVVLYRDYLSKGATETARRRSRGVEPSVSNIEVKNDKIHKNDQVNPGQSTKGFEKVLIPFRSFL